MPSLLDLRRRIRAVKSTQQITKAMKMISASKLRRAQERVVGARPFALQMQRVLNSLASRVDPSSHPLLAERDRSRIGHDVRRVLLIVVTADKGLCGGFNTNIIKAASGFINKAGGAGRAWSGRPQGARLLQAPRFRSARRRNRDFPAREVRRREAHRRDGHRGIHERPRVEGLHRLQRVQVGHAAARDDGAVAADSEERV